MSATLAVQVAAGGVLAATGAQALLALGSAVRRARHDARARRLAAEDFRRAIAARQALREIERRQAELSWGGARKFRVARKVEEAQNICSFYLEPHDGRELPPFHPGQFLTFRLAIPGHAEPVVRCYSLSDAYRPDEGSYRVTIKRVLAPPDEPAAPPGLVSSHFHDALQEGDILDVLAPSGSFYLDQTKDTPVCLVAGGVGITPLLAMLEEIVASDVPRETVMFLGVRNGAEHPMKNRLRQIVRDNPQVRLRVFYSRPGPEDEQGRDYDLAGHVSVDAIRSELGSTNYDFYTCGPPPMMALVQEGLEAWGVPESRVHFEAFGPASVQKPVDQPPCSVTFKRAGKTVTWTPESGTLLDLAREAEVPLAFGCRVGDCGTCLAAVRSGDTKALRKGAFQVSEGSCLTCVSIPIEDLVIDA